MNVLDLSSIRCPLALVTLKMTLKSELLSTDNKKKRSLKILFSTQSAMSDIILYLDKKLYQYQVFEEENNFSLVITINHNNLSSL